MALELESIIMEEIGLGQHYNWFNGSGSCRWIRQEAARKLPDVILAHQKKGEAIAEPYPPLISAVRQIADHGEGSDYSLTRTWEAASYVIAAHIHAAQGDKEPLIKIRGYLQRNYIAARPTLNDW